jgi:hypothetical protein
MARRARAVTYAEAMTALHDTQRALIDILQLRLGQNIREQLQLLSETLARLLERDNGRRR